MKQRPEHLSLLYQRFGFDYFFVRLSRCRYLFGCFFSVFAHILFVFFVFVPCFKWENKWIIISRPPERPISCALGSAVHFTVRIFYEALSTVVCVCVFVLQLLMFFCVFIRIGFVFFFLSLLGFIPIGLFSEDKSFTRK